jgi:hypothetical protein
MGACQHSDSKKLEKNDGLDRREFSVEPDSPPALGKAIDALGAVARHRGFRRLEPFVESTSGLFAVMADREWSQCSQDTSTTAIFVVAPWVGKAIQDEIQAGLRLKRG